METVLVEKLRAKMSEMKAEFDRHKERVVEIDNLMTKLQKEKEQRQTALVSLNGGFKAIESLVIEATNVTEEHQHGNTNDLQG